MSNPAFIVDGFTEKLVIGSLCPGRPVSRTDLNGKSVTLDAIANKISSLIRLFNNRHYPIIIVIDREQRAENCSELCETLEKKIVELGFENHDIRICFADRMFENWIIADWAILNSTITKPEITDNLHGSGELKKAIGSYNKTTDGVELFLKCNLETVYQNSPSFKNLVDMLSDINCPSLNFEK
jgi:hypothetical protein